MANYTHVAHLSNSLEIGGDDHGDISDSDHQPISHGDMHQSVPVAEEGYPEHGLYFVDIVPLYAASADLPLLLICKRGETEGLLLECKYVD